MLVHDFALVCVPCARLAEAIGHRGEDLLTQSVRAALADAAEPHGPTFELQVGAAQASSQATVVPFDLRLPGGSSFHRLQGDLEFFALDASCCQVRLSASYGWSVRQAPSLVDHARVEGTVRAMLTNLARAVEAGATLHPSNG